MDNIKDFPIDNWIRQHGPSCSVQLHSSSAPIISVNELQRFSTDESDSIFDYDLKLDYGPFEGSEVLRSRIAEMHSTKEVPITADNVIITPGSILANFLILQTICKPGDHVICQYPVFSQLHLLPKHAGIDISLWQMKPPSWQPDIVDLEQMIKPNTKAIILNNPNNPTGAVLSKDKLQQIADIAKKCDITVFCDEVFWPLFHSEAPKPPPFVSLGYPNSVSSGSLSKAYGLPGVRVGWVVSANKSLLRKILVARDYTTTTVSRLDDSLAAFTLSPNVLPNLVRTNLEHCQDGIRLIDEFVKNSPRCRWVKPEGGGTAFVQILNKSGEPVDDAQFCAKLAQAAGLCVVPCGWCFREDGTDDFKGYCRFPLGQPDALRKGLPVLQRYLETLD